MVKFNNNWQFNFSCTFKNNLIIAINSSYSLHQNISFKRAFNPILGETYEGFFAVDEDEFEREWNIGKGLSIGFDVKKPQSKSDESDNDSSDSEVSKQRSRLTSVNVIILL